MAMTTVRPMIATVALMLTVAFNAAAHGWASGEWIADPRTGCWFWVSPPGPAGSVHWSGSCRDGLVEGTGTLQILFGGKLAGRYEGPVVAGQLQGHGVMVFGDSDSRYEGDWRASTRHGHGVQTWKDGSRYDGGWKDNKASGSGAFIDRNGNNWVGTWLSGCLRQPDRRAVRFGVGIGTAGCPPY